MSCITCTGRILTGAALLFCLVGCSETSKTDTEPEEKVSSKEEQGKKDASDGRSPDGGDPVEFTTEEWEVIETLSPLPDKVPASPSNQYADDEAAAEFGQMLFFENMLGGHLAADSSRGKKGDPIDIACTECHAPDDWFDEPLPTRNSVGSKPTKASSLTLVNVGFNDWVYWSGRADSLWTQAAAGLEGSVGGTRLSVARKVYVTYKDEYEAIFGALDPALDPDAPDTDRFPPSGKPASSGAEPGAWEGMTEEDQNFINRLHSNLAKAIAAYERKLISRDAPFDRFVAGEQDALSESAKRGLRLFIGKAECVECHSGPFFSDNDFHNIALAQRGDAELGIPDEDTGRFSGITRAQGSQFSSDGEFSDDRETGKLDLTPEDEMLGQFRTQSLRHIEGTAPYMHAGQINTLDGVVRHYNGGGSLDGYVGTKDELMKELDLSDGERADLVEFMKSLTGEPVDANLMEDTHKADGFDPRSLLAD